jgi:hypothetical protein
MQPGPVGRKMTRLGMDTICAFAQHEPVDKSIPAKAGIQCRHWTPAKRDAPSELCAQWDDLDSGNLVGLAFFSENAVQDDIAPVTVAKECAPQGTLSPKAHFLEYALS